MTTKILSAISAFIILAATTFGTVSAQQAPTFRTGDIVTAVNNTTRNADWADPVAAAPGQIIEYRIVVQNMTEGSTATDVLVRANFPTTASSNPQVTMSASANGVTVSDTATVNVSGGNTHLIIYINGHTRVFSPGCPGGCNVDDSFRDGGPINVGNLAFGQSAQVTFKAGITNPGPASPAPSPSVAPSTPPASAAPTQTQTQTQTVNVTQNNNAPAVAGVKTLPKTGLPLAALVGLGALPAGLALKKFRKSPASEDAPESIWEDRQIKLDS